MFNLSELKKTRFYQDVFAEGQAEAQAQLQAQAEAQLQAQAEAQAEAKQREKTAILRMVSLGLTTEDIARVFDLPVAEVAATIAQAQQEQAEQN